MLALMATVGLAFGAKADVLNSTGFENYTGAFNYAKDDTGGTEGLVYWVVTNAAADLSQTVVADYDASEKPEKVPDAFVDATTTNKYLKVDTGSDVLYRRVKEVGAESSAKEIGDGLYFDANVQFTASDAEPDYDSADKLIVWLYNDETAGTTNLMITAAVGQDSLGNPTVITNFVTSATVNADTWYRLTVKALKDNSAHTCFQVYVNENLVEATYNEETISTFYSMVRSSGEGLTISAVGFKGTGAVDNLVWTTEDPFPAPVVDDVALTISVTGEDAMLAGLTEQVGDGAASEVNVENPENIVATVDDVITFVAKVADGFTPTVAGYVLQKSAETDEDDCYAYTFTVTVTQAMIDDGLTLTINVTADEEPPTPSTVVTPTAEEIASGEITVTAETTAIKVGGVDVSIEAFNVDGTKATLKAPVVADTAAEEDDAFVIDDEKDEVTINVNPVVGLFYGVSAETDLDDLARPATLTQFDGTNAAEIFTVSKPGAEKGFFKVYSDVKE